jgi:hypothetical protein
MELVRFPPPFVLVAKRVYLTHTNMRTQLLAYAAGLKVLLYAALSY